MFLWADGGNLSDFWTNCPKPDISANLVKDIVHQLRGMADALQELHNFGEKLKVRKPDHPNAEYHYRHGDIKPANILCFPDEDGSPVGKLVISDLGSAQHHSVATRIRERTTGKAWATKMYEPPESETKKLAASSRLHDIWSMGCVTLEFMIWLLYGVAELNAFRTAIEKEDVPASFFVVEEKGDASQKVAKLHPVVKARLSSLAQDARCQPNTALGDLLEIIETKLLVIKIPEHTPSNQTNNVVVTGSEDDIDSSARIPVQVSVSSDEAHDVVETRRLEDDSEDSEESGGIQGKIVVTAPVR